jgi:hypothetical protein
LSHIIVDFLAEQHRHRRILSRLAGLRWQPILVRLFQLIDLIAFQHTVLVHIVLGERVDNGVDVGLVSLRAVGEMLMLKDQYEHQQRMMERGIHVQSVVYKSGPAYLFRSPENWREPGRSGRL